MSNTLKYQAHFKPIIFPALPDAKPIATGQFMPPPPSAGSEAIHLQLEDGQAENTQSLPFTALIASLHQQFLAQQTAIQQQHLQLQQELWQRLVQALIHKKIPAAKTLPGPKFSRADLEAMASGPIAPYFGEWFAPLDQYPRLIRMPEPPLLLADRVTGIDAQPNSFGTGTIWTETDVKADAWYLHQGRMPPGITIESGQADLLLACWLGFDHYNQGERVYRLLGCELSFQGELPKPGDTLRYDIHIDGHAKQGDIRIFFFHYDCHINGELRIRVRNGQAGFFSDEELAESGGVLWDPTDESCPASLPLDPPEQQSRYSHFTQQQLIAFSQGDVLRCFGAGFERSLSHTCTPRISSGNMLFLHAITDFSPRGGPWQRGYIRAIQNIQPEDWFFKGHFKNDPCMPGTLMLEGGLQLAACYLTALGFTLNRDGWRFEPVIQETYRLRCRGQVRPHSQQVVYEIFVSSVVAGPIPTLYGDLLGTVDGLKSFHTKIGLSLKPDWPLDQNPELLKYLGADREDKPVPTANGFCFDAKSLLACAWGKPSSAFGALYKPFDNYRKVPRSPAPPYHFISRVTEINAQMGELVSGGTASFEFDIPAEAWYFDDNAYPTLPFCVLLESALQPCGWLAAFAGSVLGSEKDLLFRNLDGNATWYQEIPPGAGSLRTQVQLTNVSQSAGMILETFTVKTYLDTECVYSMDTVFGFFPKEAFDTMAGLPIPEHEKDLLQQQSDFLIDLSQYPAPFFSGTAALPKGKLLMLDRITGYWPQQAGFVAQLRAEKTIEPGDWFFKVHFLNDPVQPGSLGIEAMIQLLQFYLLQAGLSEGLINPHFEPLGLGSPIDWKYRGQVVPENKKIQVLLSVLEVQRNAERVFAKAQASLWVDGLRIYEVNNLSVTITL